MYQSFQVFAVIDSHQPFGSCHSFDNVLLKRSGKSPGSAGFEHGTGDQHIIVVSHLRRVAMYFNRSEGELFSSLQYQKQPQDRIQLPIACPEFPWRRMPASNQRKNDFCHQSYSVAPSIRAASRILSEVPTDTAGRRKSSMRYIVDDNYSGVSIDQMQCNNFLI